jgi:hypothetical protein
VDRKPFFDHDESVMPFLGNDDPPTTTERLQSPAKRARHDDTARCILRAARTGPSPFASNRHSGTGHYGPGVADPGYNRERRVLGLVAGLCEAVLLE